MAAATRTIAIQYEDFNPNYEWKEEQASDILLLHLPEFRKEEMKITYVHSTRVIRVTGEQRITNKKWRRFNKVFPIPDNCNIQEIQAKFQTPTLTITLPKITPSSTPTPTPLLEQQNQNPQKPQTINNKKQEESLQNHEKPQIQKDDTTTDSNKIKKQELNPSNIPQIPPTDDHKQEKDKKKKDDLEEEEEEENNSKKRKETLMLEAQEIISKKIRKEDHEKKLIENYGEKAKEVKKRIMEFGKKEMSSEDYKQSIINVGVAILVIAALGVYIYSSSSSSNPTSKD